MPSFRSQILAENSSMATALEQPDRRGTGLPDAGHGETVRGVVETCSASLI